MSNKYKYEDLILMMQKLEKHSKRGDISIEITREGTLIVEYMSNLETDTMIEVYPSEYCRHVTISEKQWLNQKKNN